MAIEVAGERVARLTRSIEEHSGTWRFAQVVAGLQALRGVQFIHAVTLICELGDLMRFETPRQLMGYLGLVPREDSSGPARRQGPITKSGNGFARRALIEAAWAYQHPARVTPIIARRQTGLAKPVRDIAWRAVAPVRALQEARRPQTQQEQDRGGHCPRTRRLRLGHRSRAQACLIAARFRPDQEVDPSPTVP